MIINIKSCFYMRLALSMCLALSATASAQQQEYSEELPQDSTQTDLFELSLQELLNISIEVASFFEESPLNVGSTVEVITAKDWKRFAARRTDDAISHLPSTMILPTINGGNAIAIRGYAKELSVRGVATLLDGVPLNSMSAGTAQYGRSNIDLGVLDKIEMIRGPGSSVYGSDAFHGVYSLKTFESDEDLIAVSAESGSNLYYQSNVKISKSLPK